MAAKLHKWHRRIGLTAALFIAFLVITGIVLQHSDDLNLPFKFLSNSWLLRHYGIKPNPITTYQLGNQTISHAGNNIYLSGKPINTQSDEIYGAVASTDEIIIATEDSLIALDHGGNLIDEITTKDGLVEPPLGLAKSSSGKIILRGKTEYWVGNDDLTKWKNHNGPHPIWVAPTLTLPALKQVIESHDMSSQISIERFLLDAHSGRIFGKYGIYIIDAAAILLLILSVTGIWLWTARK